jgi:hypothetical protein
MARKNVKKTIAPRTFFDNEMDKIIFHLTMGLATDGGHHKQYHLFKVLEVVNPEIYKAYVNAVEKEVIACGIPD